MADNAYAGSLHLRVLLGTILLVHSLNVGTWVGIDVLFFLRVPTSMLSHSVLTEHDFR